MPKIICVSLNPAFDTTIQVDGLSSRDVNQILSERTDVGGKALNVAAALKKFDVSAKVVLLAGEESRPRLEQYFGGMGLDGEIVPVAGKVRENLTLVLPDESNVKLDRAGTPANEADLGRVLALLENMLEKEDLVMLCGSLPPGITPDSFGAFAAKIKSWGCRVYLDTRSLMLPGYLTICPDLIKPNREEFLSLIGEQDWSDDMALCQARQLLDQGVGSILLSMGRQGMLYFDRGHAVQVTVPKVKVCSTVGAGDASLAGFVYAKEKALPILECVRWAASFGTAAVMTQGTQPPNPDTVMEIYRQTCCEDWKRIGVRNCNEGENPEYRFPVNMPCR